jgi:hypothetical protein
MREARTSQLGLTIETLLLTAPPSRLPREGQGSRPTRVPGRIRPLPSMRPQCLWRSKSSAPWLIPSKMRIMTWGPKLSKETRLLMICSLGLNNCKMCIHLRQQGMMCRYRPTSRNISIKKIRPAQPKSAMPQVLSRHPSAKRAVHHTPSTAIRKAILLSVRSASSKVTLSPGSEREEVFKRRRLGLNCLLRFLPRQTWRLPRKSKSWQCRISSTERSLIASIRIWWQTRKRLKLMARWW